MTIYSKKHMHALECSWRTCISQSQPSDDQSFSPLISFTAHLLWAFHCYFIWRYQSILRYKPGYWDWREIVWWCQANAKFVRSNEKWCWAEFEMPIRSEKDRVRRRGRRHNCVCANKFGFFPDLLSRAFLSTSMNELCTRILLALTGQWFIILSCCRPSRRVLAQILIKCKPNIKGMWADLEHISFYLAPPKSEQCGARTLEHKTESRL